MDITPAQKATLLLAQDYFVTAGRMGDSIMVKTDVRAIKIKNVLKSVGIENFNVDGLYSDIEKCHIVLVSFRS